MPARIVTAHYRYKRPPRKKKPVLLEVPAVVVKRAPRSQQASAPKPAAPANDDRKSVIVTARKRKSRFGDVPDMAPEEHKRCGDAADALFRAMVRRTTAKD
jgi:hypothetical protein